MKTLVVCVIVGLCLILIGLIVYSLRGRPFKDVLFALAAGLYFSNALMVCLDQAVPPGNWPFFASMIIFGAIAYYVSMNGNMRRKLACTLGVGLAIVGLVSELL